MEITGINAENAGYFKHLCPEEILNDEESVKFGVIDDEGYAAAIGAVSLSDGIARLDWIYTDPEKREKGIGGFLLKNLIKLLEDFDLEGIEADYYSSEAEIEFLLSDMEFLIGRDNSMYGVPVGDIINGREMDLLYEKRLDETNAFTLADKRGMSVFRNYTQSGEVDIERLEDISFKYSVINTDGNGNITGGLFVSEMGDDLHVDYLFNEASSQGICELFCAFSDAITGDGKERGRLIFTDLNDSVISMVETLTENDREDYVLSDHMHAFKLFN